ncbi:MAG: hypothetical protein ACK5L3_15755 [Oscillospiraceae bacterium]
MEMAREVLLKHLRLYPEMQIEDCIKLLYQSFMGIEHLIEDRAAFEEYLRQERALPEVLSGSFREPEDIGQGRYRMYLSSIKEFSDSTAAALCLMGANLQQQNPEGLNAALETLEQMAEEGLFAFSAADAVQKIEKYKEAGCPPLSHSGLFRQTYRPHYRLIGKEAAIFLPVFVAIEKEMRQKEYVVLAIDGMSAAGKSSLSALLQKVYGCGALHADDFFLQQHQRTAQRLAETGGNIDYERFSKAVHLAGKGRAFAYQPFNCQTMQLDPALEVPKARLTIIEGVYSLHPKVGAKPDISVFLKVDSALQQQRVLKRSGAALARRFAQEWIPMENRYFQKMNIEEKCNISICTDRL